MANASAKRIASQNEKAIRNLRAGMLVSFFLAFLLRLFFRRDSLPPSKGLILLYASTSVPTIFLYRYLSKIGTSKRDPTTGALISSGEDLNQTGTTEWCFDVLYITWACQVGSAIVGEWFWWLYLIIPGYAVFKIWTGFISPFVLGRSSSSTEETDASATTPVSKRQQKLKARQEKGDPRVKAVHAKKY